jgi:beta-lactamase regulating signal transducer with metallopeptidase domain
MANDLLHGLIRANLAGTAVALILLVARSELRKHLGPSAVYALWLAVPAAGLASLLPSRIITTVLHTPSAGSQAAVAVQTSVDAGQGLMLGLTLIWAAGAATAAVWIVWRHYRFLATLGRLESSDGVVRAVASNAGPAVIGLVSPRILLPGDFETRFSPRERSVILAHEKIHLARGDSRINAVVLMLQCLNWFNPLAHVAARALRLDQELACDAGVMAQFPMARRSYAEAMLKSQADPVTVPAGCQWQAKGASALSNRLTLLKAEPLSRSRMTASLVVALLMTSGAGLASWAAQPARQRTIIEPAIQTTLYAAAAATAPQSHPTAPPSTQTARLEPRRAAEVEAPDPLRGAVEWTTKLREAAQGVNPTLVRWDSMPMPPETVDQTPGDSPPSDARRVTVAANGDKVETYRNGDYRMKSDFTRVGDKVQVSVQLFKSDAMVGSGVTTTRPGEAAYVALSNGQMAQVTPGETAYIITRNRLPSASAAPS